VEKKQRVKGKKREKRKLSELEVKSFSRNHIQEKKRERDSVQLINTNVSPSSSSLSH